MLGPLRWMRRKRLAKQPFPQEWLDILNARVPFFRTLSGPLLERFLELVKIFAHEKYFTAAGGMAITDEVRVVISACAVRLILHLDISYYDKLTEIIVYPYVYRHPEDEDAILGEADDWGTVVLSWPTPRCWRIWRSLHRGTTQLLMSSPTYSTEWPTVSLTELPG